MNRRSLLKILSGFIVLPKSWTTGASARSSAAIASAQNAAALFSASDVATLAAIAEVVLPSALTDDDRRLAVRAFTSWFADYREGADMGHGYGSSTLRASSGPSPIARYRTQFAALDAAAAGRGAASFAALSRAARRDVIEAALDTPQRINRLPGQPTGANLVADFMGSWFNSQDGWNLCYQAEINRDSCRTIDDSLQPPRAIRG